MPPSKAHTRGRKAAQTRPLRRILILCEDTKSSRDYLAAFPHDRELVEIECIGTGRNTDSLMESAIERARSARSQGRPYERVWVVFDKDDWPMQNFNRAFDLARSWNEVTACWSNECFEIWRWLPCPTRQHTRHYRHRSLAWPCLNKFHMCLNLWIVTWIENIERWRQLPAEEKLLRRWKAIPRDVAQSMAFEREPVEMSLLHAIHARIELPALLKQHGASSPTPR